MDEFTRKTSFQHFTEVLSKNMKANQRNNLKIIQFHPQSKIYYEA